MRFLNVAQKNESAKTIADLLSNGTATRREGQSLYNKIYEFDAQVKGEYCKMAMTSVCGHLLNYDFVKPCKWHETDPASFFDEPIEKKCDEHYQRIKDTLEQELVDYQGLIIWTDCNREGENIGSEIIEVCRAIEPNIQVHRAIFSAITAASVKKALKQLGEPDQRKSDAVDVRCEMDLRTGAVFTRLQSMHLQEQFPEELAGSVISYGSCHIPTLGFVVERYKAVEAFVSEPLWKIKVTHSIEDLTIDFDWARNRVPDKEQCENNLQLCQANPKATVENVAVTSESKWRPTPMNAAELEKLGWCKLKVSAKDTMNIAEKLYMRGIISYPRTETNQFSREIDLKSLVEIKVEHPEWGTFARQVIEWGPNPRNGNQVDNVHPPIHPVKLVTDLVGDEARVYELICRHFLACVSKDAEGFQTVVNIDVAGEKFTATGLCIKERNYLDVYIYDGWNAKQIHEYERGQQFDPTEISMQGVATAAPSLVTEADLIDLMQKHGIGTDNTYADHIDTIKERGYIGILNEGYLVPSIIGMSLYEGYEAMGLPLAMPNLRAEFEADLKRICEGDKEPHVVLREQKKKYKQIYKQMADNISLLDEKMAQRLNEAPSTGTNYDATDSKTHWPMIGCLNFPDSENLDNCEDFTMPEETCRSCGSSVNVVKFCSASVYYKSLFNATSGWYQTWLHNDGTFCDSFNIDLVQVEANGPIVSDIGVPGETCLICGASVKMLKFCAASNYYNYLSNVPSGWYRADNKPINTAPKCDCGLKASSLKVRKDGPNKGRPFYTCHGNKLCKFFKWADRPDNQPSTSGAGQAAKRKSAGSSQKRRTKDKRPNSGEPHESEAAIPHRPSTEQGVPRRGVGARASRGGVRFHKRGRQRDPKKSGGQKIGIRQRIERAFKQNPVYCRRSRH